LSSRPLAPRFVANQLDHVDERAGSAADFCILSTPDRARCLFERQEITPVAIENERGAALIADLLCAPMHGAI
jgi:hypothetical protein